MKPPLDQNAIENLKAHARIEIVACKIRCRDNWDVSKWEATSSAMSRWPAAGVLAEASPTGTRCATCRLSRRRSRGEKSTTVLAHLSSHLYCFIQESMYIDGTE